VFKKKETEVVAAAARLPQPRPQFPRAGSHRSTIPDHGHAVDPAKAPHPRIVAAT